MFVVSEKQNFLSLREFLLHFSVTLHVVLKGKILRLLCCGNRIPTICEPIVWKSQQENIRHACDHLQERQTTGCPLETHEMCNFDHIFHVSKPCRCSENNIWNEIYSFFELSSSQGLFSFNSFRTINYLKNIFSFYEAKANELEVMQFQLFVKFEISSTDMSKILLIIFDLLDTFTEPFSNFQTRKVFSHMF